MVMRFLPRLGQLCIPSAASLSLYLFRANSSGFEEESIDPSPQEDSLSIQRGSSGYSSR